MAKGNAKEKLVKAAMHRMLSRGYAATTVDEICDAAGVSKGSFYHSFKAKEDIGLAALELFHQEALKRYGSGEFTAIADPVERAFGYLDHMEAVAKDIWGEGCLLGNFAMDLSESHPAIREKVSALFNRSNAGVARMFEPIASLQKKGKGPSADELARHFLSLIEGAIVFGKAHGDWKRIPEGIRQFRRYLKLLAA